MSKSKAGRNDKKCKRYEAEGRFEKNKARRMAKDKKRQEYLKKRQEKREGIMT